MLDKQDLEFRINLAIAKSRNIVYYRQIDLRTRSQYMHILRILRNQMLRLLKRMTEEHEYYNLFKTIVYDVIPPEVEPKDCTPVIRKLKEVLEKNGIIIK